jgi:hypothetical protein
VLRKAKPYPWGTRIHQYLLNIGGVGWSSACRSSLDISAMERFWDLVLEAFMVAMPLQLNWTHFQLESSDFDFYWSLGFPVPPILTIECLSTRIFDFYPADGWLVDRRVGPTKSFQGPTIHPLIA